MFQETGSQPDLAGHDYILERQLKPEARKDVPELLRDLGVRPTSMIDISDGLARRRSISAGRAVPAPWSTTKLPIDPATYQAARDFNLDPTTVALSGGRTMSCSSRCAWRITTRSGQPALLDRRAHDRCPGRHAPGGQRKVGCTPSPPKAGTLF